MKLAIVTSHPIQYYAPWFRYMAKYIDLHVFYMHQEGANERAEGDFGVVHEWDTDLLSGYNYTFLNNISKNPTVNSFYGCDIPEIYTIIKEGAFDAVLVLGWYLKGFIQAVIACKLYKTPVMVRGDSQIQINESIVKKIIRKIVYSILFKVFDAFLYVGENNKRYLEYHNVNKNNMFFCPHFIEQNFFYQKSQACDKIILRQDMGIEQDSIVLLFVGKFIEKKRPLDILKAMKLLYREKIEVELIFVGSGILQTELEQYCDENSELRVHFVGFKNQTELPAYYAVADVLILPSASGETWGLVVNEAFATLTPAIVSDQVGCMPDLIDSENTGEVFKCGNIFDLADAIKNFFSWFDKKHVNGKIQEKNDIYSMEYATNNLINAIKRIQK